jgi:hypothetical protein
VYHTLTKISKVNNLKIKDGHLIIGGCGWKPLIDYLIIVMLPFTHVIMSTYVVITSN